MENVSLQIIGEAMGFLDEMFLSGEKFEIARQLDDANARRALGKKEDEVLRNGCNKQSSRSNPITHKTSALK